MYELQIDGRVYSCDPTDRTRTPFTLVSAMRAAYGCGNAHILRADGTIVVRDAGRAFSDLRHEPLGRRVQRRSVAQCAAVVYVGGRDDSAVWGMGVRGPFTCTACDKSVILDNDAQRTIDGTRRECGDCVRARVHTR